ncbi:MAG: PASTA domain-containing protein [Bacteroidetes bacterium]|nr:PASTA domain-containing protein [Bacteroidota bacterium]
MSFWQFLKSRTFFKNLGLVILLTGVLLFITFRLLKLYTLHGEVITLPNYSGLNLADLNYDPSHNDLTFIVVDSVYDDTKEKGSIVMQDPLPESKVKKGRKIYLTVVAMLPEMVSMPNLRELSLRQAVSLLQTYGLKAGNLQFVPSQFENAVLDQKYNGMTIEPTTMIEKGSSIELLVGKRGSKVPVPCLIGFNEAEALTAIKQASLNVGNLHFLDEQDQMHSRIYQQMPSCTTNLLLEMGTPVEIWFRSDRYFNFDELIKLFRKDTLRVDSINLDYLNSVNDSID